MNSRKFVELEERYEEMEKLFFSERLEMAKRQHVMEVKFFQNIFKSGTWLIDVYGLYCTEGDVLTITDFIESVSDYGDRRIDIKFNKGHEKFCRSANVLFDEFLRGSIEIKG